MNILDSVNYQLVSPKNFSAEQKQFVNKFKETTCLISSQADMILGAKDIHSRHFISTDAYAKLVALPNGYEITDRFDRDMPCEGTAQFADCFIEEDNALLNSGDLHQKKSTLNVHEYSGGIQALVFNKHILKHLPSQSILGTVYSAHEIEITNFFKLMPNYIEEFGIGCSIENVTGTLSVGDKLLTDYEHEVCFLIMMNWDFKQIANFMNKHRPKPRLRVADTIHKCKNRICYKLGLFD